MKKIYESYKAPKMRMIEVNISPLLQYLRSISFVNLNKSHILLKLQGDAIIEAYGKFTSILFIE